MNLDLLADDLRFAVRQLRRHPAYTVAAAVTLALGIGATTAVFAVLNATIVRPLPFADPGRLVGLSAVQPGANGADETFVLSEPELVRWRAATNALVAVEGLQPRALALTGAGDPEVIRGAAVTSGLLPMLGIEPEAGRVFAREEETANVPVTVIAHDLAAALFGGSRASIGRTLTLDGRTYEVTGVMPAGFHPLLDESRVWIPLNPRIDPARANSRMTVGAGRLRPGATPAAAAAELAVISAGLAREFPVSHSHVRPQVRPLRDQLLGDRTPALVALTTAALMLLGLACANVVNLTLGHMLARRTELAVRSAVGARGGDLVQQHVVQSLLLTALGAGGGLLVAATALPPLLALYARRGRPVVDVSLDWRVAAFVVGISIVTTIASAIVPAVRGHRVAAESGTFLGTARVGTTPGDRTMSGMLVALQVAFAILLLCGAGAFLVSLRSLMQTAPGFRADGVLTMQLSIAPGRYPDVRTRSRYVGSLVERVAAVPGVLAAGSTQTTFMPNESMQTLLWVDDRPVDEASALSANIRHVTAGYFPALNVPIVEGRAVDSRDQFGSTPVCVVSRAFARAFWPSGGALGHRVRRTGATAAWMTIVGIAGDVMDEGAGIVSGPTLYVPYLQANTPTARVSLVARTAGDPLDAAAAVRAAIWSVDALQAVDRVAPLERLLVESTADQRFRTVLLAVFAALGLVIAIVGVYAVTAADVASRTTEMGIRLALGARPARLVVELFGRTMVRVAGGAALGVAAYVPIGRAIESLLYRTRGAAPPVVVGAAAVVAAGAAVAAWLRTRAIARLSPLTAIRGDQGGMIGMR